MSAMELDMNRLAYHTEPKATRLSFMVQRSPTVALALNWLAFGLNAAYIVFIPSATIVELSEPMWPIEVLQVNAVG
ncbi:hypothetical protein K1719_018584 [Acacia pycnantha]|nr:hypothetical protein K1719_018584 [Acacia pycnantha]